MKLKHSNNSKIFAAILQQIRTLKIIKIIFVVLAIVIGFYPLVFLNKDTNTGLFALKSQEVLTSFTWNFAFYLHIFLGGAALSIGWVLFLRKFRIKRIEFHKTIGKIYILLVLISGITGLYIAIHATGGIIAKLGFSGMSIVWLVTTIVAFTSIRNKNIQKHQRWMIRSYAVTFVGVTFRLWLPALIFIFDLAFIEAYRIDSWISWILNLIFVEFLIRKKSMKIM